MKQWHFEIIKRFCTLLVKFLIFLMIMSSRSICLYLRNGCFTPAKGTSSGCQLSIGTVQYNGFVKV